MFDQSYTLVTYSVYVRVHVCTYFKPSSATVEWQEESSEEANSGAIITPTSTTPTGTTPPTGTTSTSTIPNTGTTPTGTTPPTGTTHPTSTTHPTGTTPPTGVERVSSADESNKKTLSENTRNGCSSGSTSNDDSLQQDSPAVNLPQKS